MKVDILITAQKYENYSFDGGYVDSENPHWKAKGVAHFKIKVEDFWLMYSEDEDINNRFIELIAGQCDDLIRYEYVDHEILWYGIKEIDGVIE